LDFETRTNIYFTWTLEKVTKRPLNVFILFACPKRARIGGKVAESGSTLAKEWREMRTVENPRKINFALKLKR
jgi:hypothetical protein